MSLTTTSAISTTAPPPQKQLTLTTHQTRTVTTSHTRYSLPLAQKIAMAFGGLDTPPGMFRGMLVMKNV